MCSTKRQEVSLSRVGLNTNLLHPKNMWLFLKISSSRLIKLTRYPGEHLLDSRLIKLRRYPGEHLLEQNSCILKQALSQGREVGRAENTKEYIE